MSNIEFIFNCAASCKTDCRLLVSVHLIIFSINNSILVNQKVIIIQVKFFLIIICVYVFTRVVLTFVYYIWVIYILIAILQI